MRLAALFLTACAGTTTTPPPAPGAPVAPVAAAPAPESPAAPAAPAAPASPDEAALARAKAAGQTLGKTLLTRVQASLQADGPLETIQVCKAEAPALTAQVAAETGVRVGRASLRRRNPANAGPAWVQDLLEELGEREAEGVAPHQAVVDTPQGRVARVALPLAVAPPCLTCHGPAADLDPALRSRLAELYPEDAALDYAVGDLRGVIWVEAPVVAEGG